MRENFSAVLSVFSFFYASRNPETICRSPRAEAFLSGMAALAPACAVVSVRVVMKSKCTGKRLCTSASLSLSPPLCSHAHVVVVVIKHLLLFAGSGFYGGAKNNSEPKRVSS
jgi:hypothetical protein